jgi:galactose mutarotase-like enzyme
LTELVELQSDLLVVTLLPDQGCDIYAIVDRASGIDVLWKAPWGRRRAGAQPYAADSHSHWLHCLSGGWQLLLPHAGAPREEAGAHFGFHGDAGVSAWDVLRVAADSARFATSLISAPLEIERNVAVDDDRLTIEERVTNQSPEPASFSWGHHPTFGAPLLEAGARLEVSARGFRVDPMAPGPFASDAAGRWPQLAGVDLALVPAEPRALLGYLTDLDEGRYRLTNARLGVGVEVRWPLEVFPHLWLWQELHGSPGFPWFRRVYAMGVEPHTTVPQGAPPPLTLAGGDSLEARVELRLLRAPFDREEARE